MVDKIEENSKALKRFTESFEIIIRNYNDVLKQINEIRLALKHKTTN